MGQRTAPAVVGRGVVGRGCKGDATTPPEYSEAATLAPQHEQFARFARGRVRGAALAVQHRNLAKEVARSHEIQRQPAAVGSPGLDADLAAAHSEQRSPGSPFWNKTSPDARCWVWQRCQLVGAQIRIHFENDRKFGLFTHCINFKCPREDLK
jgi:hypothetical protein